MVSYGYNGGFDNFVLMFRYFLKEKMVFVVMVNGLDYDFNLIEIVFVKSLLNWYYDIFIFIVYKLYLKELNEYIGMYLSDIYFVIIYVVK